MYITNIYKIELKSRGWSNLTMVCLTTSASHARRALALCDGRVHARVRGLQSFLTHLEAGRCAKPQQSKPWSLLFDKRNDRVTQ